ncbi:DUF4199 domain-containing protein [Echinicola marina]|uniref:DUF4199 domain-containing protein n=1 Tax=Echinicola marina TaxID=2859768 RepID=UPI001CF60AE3|nr:DUF4199 domain-containing protein [Echinicola marina]UCS93408.1 DUF4199 domain-containing protein [Echinicola marina]
MTKYIKNSYLFGIVGGALSLLAFWVLKALDLEPIDFTLFFACMITPVFVFIGMKNFRDHYSDGELIFAQGMTVGFVIYTLLALVTALGIALFLNFDEEIFLSHRAEKIAWLEGQKDYITENVNKEAFEETMAKNLSMSISDIALDVFLKIFMLELFFTIIISIILKRTKS